MPEAPFVPVIPAGGAGTRLWPLSRRARPKFLLDLTGSGASLLQQTVRRLAPLADRPPIIVTGHDHALAVQEQLDEMDSPSSGAWARVVAEPAPRNSMPAIALAAALVEREEPDAVIGSFAADHLIADQEEFGRTVATARRAAEHGFLVTLGIRPTSPATGFGYIEQAEVEKSAAEQAGGGSSGGTSGAGPTALRALGALPVSRFVEKPDLVTAEQFVAAGTFFWNAGMFVVRARVLLDELAAQIPGLARGAREIAAAAGTPAYSEVLARIWPTLTSIAIDHALAEPLAAAGRVAVVPASFGWDDVGDFAALARQLREWGPEGEESAVRVLGTSTVDAIASTATVYGSTDRHIALVGLQGISIVDTEDALLVLADEQAQDLTRLVGLLDEHGRGHLR
ncbi:mannose-1-phosphate guanylyltransferase [Brachybacterium sp. AOP3-A1-3]|uniref:mannose-1-phosphate guanylyltransferase n=1 Tax=Brachybacterium sp. AOP3-A1-3 TaxID=3457699 RepID=UPI004033A5D4